jgi:hypothetical protein
VPTSPTRLLPALIALLVPAAASAHGIQGHMHVTAWAIENLPPGEVRDFFDDPEVLNAAIFGAAFTDSGYWPQSGDLSQRSREYGEHTHWEPFVTDFIAWIRENDPPPWDDLESRKTVAFLMGCAAHGLQDEIFDSLFLDHADVHDGGGQGEVDPATDGMLAVDAHLRFVPEPWYPVDTLVELYDGLAYEIDARTIDLAVQAMVGLYVNESGADVAEAVGSPYFEALPWTRAHYLDPAIPGSLRSEIVPTGRYLLAIWERLHGRFDETDLVTHTYPETHRRLLSGVAGSPDSRVTLVFGAGVEMSTVSASLVDGAAAPADFTLRGTRWGGDRGLTRLIRLDPSQDLTPGGTYTAILEPGAEVSDGFTTATPFAWTFEVECDDATECAPLPEPFVPGIDGEGGSMPPTVRDVPPVEPDPDAGADAGADAGGDAGADSGANADAGVPDAATPDGGAQASTSEDGCTAAGPTALALAWLPLLALPRRRRR